MKTLFKLSIFLLSLSYCGTATKVFAGTSHLGCHIFQVQELAQTYLRFHPEVATKLDPDGNGKACEHLYSEVAFGTLNNDKWSTIAKRYYQSRYRTEFSSNNHLVDLWEAQDLLGFTGIKIKHAHDGQRQHWLWRDNQDPKKEIRATFMYYQLIDLKGTGFDIK